MLVLASALLAPMVTLVAGCGALPRSESATAASGMARAESFPAGAEVPVMTTAEGTRAAAAPEAPSVTSDAGPRPGHAPSRAPAPAAAGTARGDGASAPSAPRAAKAEATRAPAQSRMVLYAGELRMRVGAGRVPATLEAAIDVADAMGGYFAARSDASVQLRVPAARFRESLVKLEALGTVTHRALRADDVSEEHHDYEVRLTNLRATRARMQELLARAGTMADTLSVERELERVAQEIDVIEGKLAFLEAHAAFARIDLAVDASPPPTVAVTPDVPPARLVDLPVPWLSALGVGRLLSFR